MGGGSGFGSFFRLPYMFSRFGAGSFIIAFSVALILLAWPLSLVEVFLGQLSRKGAIDSLGHVHPKAKGIGLICVLIASVVGLYFSVVLCWVVVPYSVGSFRRPVPYALKSAGELEEYFFKHAVVKSAANIPIFFALVGLWIDHFGRVRKIDGELAEATMVADSGRLLVGKCDRAFIPNHAGRHWDAVCFWFLHQARA